jgi:SAM-dependent methyltransferase
VNPDAVQKLLALNRQFYRTFAEPFSTTRMRLQPGVIRILEQLPASGSILDLGCGNGHLASQLAQKLPEANYIGLDNSPALLEAARHACSGRHNINFRLSDLTSPDWEKGLSAAPDMQASCSFNTILAFAVLHHIPSAASRENILKQIRSLLHLNGQFIHSEWQFLKSLRLRARIQPWETIGLSVQDVDPGDYLLDWRHGGQGLRYVHHFSEDELAELATASGFVISKTFFADGEGGNLGLYQVWLPERN